MAARTSLTGVVLIAVLAFTTQASEIFIDDFSDGNDIGWTHRDYSTSASGGPGQYDVVGGAYGLMSTNPVPTGQVGPIVATWDQSSAPIYQDGYLRARVKANANALPWLVLRHQPNSRSFYLFGIDPSGVSPVFFHNRIDNFTIATDGGFDIPGETVEIGEEWMIEAGAVGNTLSMKVWKPGESEPAAPQWTKIDSTYSTGSFGVGASHWSPQPASIVSATFDDIKFRPVPEPSSLALAGVAVAVGFYRFQRRRGR